MLGRLACHEGGEGASEAPELGAARALELQPPPACPVAQALEYRIRQAAAAGDDEIRERDAREGAGLQPLEAVPLQCDHGVAVESHRAQR